MTNDQLAFQTLAAEVRHWLNHKQSTLWANWIITDPAGAQQAAEWFASELQAFMRHRMEHPWNTRDLSDPRWDVVA